MAACYHLQPFSAPPGESTLASLSLLLYDANVFIFDLMKEASALISAPQGFRWYSDRRLVTSTIRFHAQSFAMLLSQEHM